MEVLVTGSGGLVGSSLVRVLVEKGVSEITGVDNDVRRYLFGVDASVRGAINSLKSIKGYYHEFSDLTYPNSVTRLVIRHKPDVIVHCAAQPSHDWSAANPLEDFQYNAVATLNLLESTRQYCPTAQFIHISTNKVYGDYINSLESRVYADESLSIDQSMHSPFGCSKLAADIYVQEYGRYYGMRTSVLRCGCITGGAHRGAELHGFLSYLMKCAMTGQPYTVYGFGGEQVRDNLHAVDLAGAIWEMIQSPPEPGAVFNMGGGPNTAVSVMQAIGLAERLTGKSVKYTVSDQARKGDHKWWITDTWKFRQQYPAWKQQYQTAAQIMKEIYETNKGEWK